MLPDANNVFGEIIAPCGLVPVRRAIEQAFEGVRTSVYRSQYDGSESLRLQADCFELESTPDSGCQHFFNGAVGGSPDDIAEFATRLAATLEAAGVSSVFEIYDDQQVLVRTIRSKATRT